jgi:hypothetical protein
VELDAISQPELEQIERIGHADLVIGILDGDGSGSNVPGSARPGSNGIAAAMRGALAEFSAPLSAVVMAHDGSPAAGAAASNGAGPAAVFWCNPPPAQPGETPQQSISEAYRRVFAIGEKVGARACGLIASPPREATRQWIYRLVQPVLNLGFDLVAPCYTRQNTEGLLNRSVLAPLHRALYGQQIQNPMGPDFGVSGKLLQQILRQDSSRRQGMEGSALASIAASAAIGGCQVCESQLGVRSQHPTDWGNLSSLLAEVLGATFLEMERRAAHWQSIRGSRVLPRFGTAGTEPPDSAPASGLDIAGMRQSFQLGTQNLQDIWGLILPPTTLLELRRISRLPEDQFRFPDPLWARVVYDFALGHRLRIISRDHLLRSFTPLYLGWIASYGLTVQTAGLTVQSAAGGETDFGSEPLAKAFEDNKSYLVSRWRWPDRFNP